MRGRLWLLAVWTAVWYGWFLTWGSFGLTLAWYCVYAPLLLWSIFRWAR